MFWTYRNYSVWPMGNLSFFDILVFLFILFVIWKIAGNHEEKKQHTSALPSPETETALDILKKRYAKGEINKKEFAEMKKELE